MGIFTGPVKKNKTKAKTGTGGAMTFGGFDMGGNVWSKKDFRWFNRGPKLFSPYSSRYNAPDAYAKSLKVKSGPDFQRTAHSGLSTGASITTSEGTFGIGQNFNSPFLSKIKKAKRIRGETLAGQL